MLVPCLCLEVMVLDLSLPAHIAFLLRSTLSRPQNKSKNLNKMGPKNRANDPKYSKALQTLGTFLR